MAKVELDAGIPVTGNIRRVNRNILGESLGVTIPKQICDQLKLKSGDLVTLFIKKI